MFQPIGIFTGSGPAYLDRRFTYADQSLAKCDIRSVRQQASLLGFKIEKNRKKLSRDAIKAYKNRLAALNGSVS